MKKNECLEMLNSNFIYERDLTGFENFIKYQNQVKNMLNLLFDETKNSWISIKDRLPEKQGHYLVKLTSSFPKNYRGIIAEFYEDNQEFYGESSEDVHEDATHWQELPNADI